MAIDIAQVSFWVVVVGVSAVLAAVAFVFAVFAAWSVWQFFNKVKGFARKAEEAAINAAESRAIADMHSNTCAENADEVQTLTELVVKIHKGEVTPEDLYGEDEESDDEADVT